MDSVLVGRELRIEIRSESEEGDVPEIEQPRIADDDVEAEPEQRVEQREDAVAEEVTAVHPERERRRDSDEEGKAGRRGHSRAETPSQPGEAGGPLSALLGSRDPLVDADARAVARVGRRRKIRNLAAGVDRKSVV